MNTKSRKYYEQRIDSNQGCVKLPTKTIPKGYPKNLTQKDFTVSDKSDFSSIIRNLEKYGVCVVPNFIEKSSCKEALKEIQPKFYRYDSWNGSPFPKETTVVTRSVLHSSTILEKIVSDPLFGGVAEKFLNERNYFMAGKVLKEYTCGIQLNSGIVYKVGPGAADQGYHREDYVHHTVHQSRNTFKHGEETMLGLGVAFTDMSKENGATRFIVGSHLWGPYDACGSFDKEMEFYIEAKEGDAVLFLGSVYHAASANHTSKDRIAGFFFMTKGYLKQEENLHLGTEMNFFKGLSLKSLQLLGLATSEPYCGHVDYMSPAYFVNPEYAQNEKKKGHSGNTLKIIFE